MNVLKGQTAYDNLTARTAFGSPGGEGPSGGSLVNQLTPRAHSFRGTMGAHRKIRYLFIYSIYRYVDIAVNCGKVIG